MLSWSVRLQKCFIRSQGSVAVFHATIFWNNVNTQPSPGTALYQKLKLAIFVLFFLFWLQWHPLHLALRGRRGSEHPVSFPDIFSLDCVNKLIIYRQRRTEQREILFKQNSHHRPHSPSPRHLMPFFASASGAIMTVTGNAPTFNFGRLRARNGPVLFANKPAPQRFISPPVIGTGDDSIKTKPSAVWRHEEDDIFKSCFLGLWRKRTSATLKVL